MASERLGPEGEPTVPMLRHLLAGRGHARPWPAREALAIRDPGRLCVVDRVGSAKPARARREAHRGGAELQHVTPVHGILFRQPAMAEAGRELDGVTRSG